MASTMVLSRREIPTIVFCSPNQDLCKIKIFIIISSMELPPSCYEITRTRTAEEGNSSASLKLAILDEIFAPTVSTYFTKKHSKPSSPLETSADLGQTWRQAKNVTSPTSHTTPGDIQSHNTNFFAFMLL